ncbi:hypothetical protein PIB30_017815 [Stylosanthes scabra]|uniref:Uncharacterized protein n=1 Tax=Stylosanthes scabra TaxID=79078 RepID=A0ABU6V7Y7_9FABA|nr:hypothetical protein [Stylosanthes scabra]
MNWAMEEDGEVDVAPQRVRRMPEAAIGHRRRGGRGGRGRDRGGDKAAEGPEGGDGGFPAGEPSGSAVPQTPAVRGRGAYYADLARCLQESPQGASGGSSSQAHARTPVDLNEPAFGPFGDFSFALGGTPPSAFVDVPTHMDADD